jgi:hypothetical protein
MIQKINNNNHLEAESTVLRNTKSERRHRNVERTVFRLNHSRANRRRGCLLVAECGVEAHDRLLLLRGEHTVLQPRLQVVDPPQPAALAVPVQPCRRPEPDNFENQCTFVFFSLKKLCIYDNTHAQKKKEEKRSRTLFLVPKWEAQSEPAARGIQLTLCSSPSPIATA